MKFVLSLAIVATCSTRCAVAQNPGHQKQSGTLPLTYQTCTTSGGCSDQNGQIVLDSNWAWVHKTGTYTNCYTGDEWDSTLCPDPKTCASNCALDNGDAQDYQNTYGITATGNKLNLQYVTGSNVGSRSYLMDTPTTYKMFKLLNQEFTFDVDVSNLPCGLNGALYFVEMQQDGGTSEYPGDKAGAAYGTGYCDAQCPHDIKFINGEANLLNWTTTGSSTGTGHYGTCCHEMDIWESNKISTAVTPHPCSHDGQYRCEGTECGDGADRDNGVCDKDGCDLAPYRLGNTKFFGPGSDFAVDSTQPVTVVTQFHTTDGTDSGDLKEIRRFYVQNGKRIDSPSFSVGGQKFDSVTDDFCAAQKKTFGDNNTFADRGGLKTIGGALGRGMVLVLSLWDDHDVHMLWLDSVYPPSKPASAPGVARGSCPTSSGDPATTEKEYPNSNVAFSNIRVGDIGSTTKVGPGPSPSSPTPAPAAPGPSKKPSPSPAPTPGPSGDCPGGTLQKCMDLCPANPPAAFKACVADCVKRCP